MKKKPDKNKAKNKKKEKDAITDLTVFAPSIPALPEDVKERIVQDAEDARLFAKPVETEEFQIGDEFYPRLRGKVLEVERYGGKWDDGELDKIRNIESEGDLPEDYELRADLTILTPDFSIITISLPPSSYKYHFAPKVRQLDKQNRDITEMLCEFAVKLIKGKKGNFPVVITKIIGPSETPLGSVLGPTPEPIQAEVHNSVNPSQPDKGNSDRSALEQEEIPF
jgi:hypothetical protein